MSLHKLLRTQHTLDKIRLANKVLEAIDVAITHKENDTVGMLESIQETCEQLIKEEFGVEYKPKSDIESFNKK